MTRTFESAWRKVERGDHHRETVDGYITGLRDPTVERISLDVQIEWYPKFTRMHGGVWQLGRATGSLGPDFPTLHDDFPLAYGDAIHNYRQALDHLIWRLVQLHGGRVKDPLGVQWPIHKSAAIFDQMKGRRTPGVPDRPQRAILKRYQPYRRGPYPQVIGWLNDLARRDKHRVVTTSVIAQVEGRLVYEVGEGMLIKGTSDFPALKKPLKPGTPLAEAEIAALVEVERREVNINGNMTTFPIVTRQGTNRAPADAVLNGSSQVIREILEEFEALY